MIRMNKAHTATVNRLARRYNAVPVQDGGPEIQSCELTIAIATQATTLRAIRQLRAFDGPRYVAVTNKEGIEEALRLTRSTPIGVMDPRGNILRPSSSMEPAFAGDEQVGEESANESASLEPAMSTSA